MFVCVSSLIETICVLRLCETIRTIYAHLTSKASPNMTVKVFGNGITVIQESSVVCTSNPWTSCWQTMVKKLTSVWEPIPLLTHWSGEIQYFDNRSPQFDSTVKESMCFSTPMLCKIILITIRSNCCNFLAKLHTMLLKQQNIYLFCILLQSSICMFYFFKFYSYKLKDLVKRKIEK